MLIIPVQDVFSQTVSVTLAGQSCQINLYQKQYTDSSNPVTGALITQLFCDVYVNSTLIIGGVICRDWNRIVRDLYLGFIGDLAFYDLQGADDPTSPGLGTRFVFVYLETTDLGGQG